MFKLITLIFTFSLIATAAPVDVDKYKFDEQEWNEKKKVNMKSGKYDGTRLYHGERTDTIVADINTTLKAVLNFENKCNNDLKEYRKFFDQKMKCPYHNPNMVESKITKEIKKSYTPLENEVERFLLQRNIYNRNKYSHVDLLIVTKGQNELKQTFFKVHIHKLTDEEAKKYIENPIEHDSVFKGAESSFTITEISKGSTEVLYTYTTWTDHWLLNKSIAVSKVFSNMAKGINLLLKSITHESTLGVPQAVAIKDSEAPKQAMVK